jgi:hypothetical protein
MYGDNMWRTEPTIGGRGVVTEIEKTFGRNPPPLEFVLAKEVVARGEVEAYHGWAGTEVTPGDPYEVSVGDVDNLFYRDGPIGKLEGETVALLIREINE